MKRIVVLCVAMVLGISSGIAQGQESGGQVTVTVKSPKPDPKGRVFVKVGGKITGTHKTQASDETASGYMKGPGSGTCAVTQAGANGVGTFTATAGKNPSRKIGDTKVFVRYTKPGNETNNFREGWHKVTVVDVFLSKDGAAYNGSIIAPDGTVWYFATITFLGKVRPSGLGPVTIVATPSKGRWSPNPAITSVLPDAKGDFSGLMTTNYLVPDISPVSIFVSFDIKAIYVGITSKHVQEILVNP